MNQLVAFFRHEDKNTRDNNWIFATMLMGSLLSLLASFVLSVEAIQLAKNPDAALSCNVNVVLNCATVAKHPSAEMLGFPNSFLGMMAEPVVITVAIAGLAGIKFPRRFMRWAQVGYTLGLAYALYLLSISFFVIQALCPWCLLVTLTTILVWFSITRYNIREKNLPLSKPLQHKLGEFIKKDYDKVLMLGFIALIVAGIILKYGDGLFR